MSNVKSFISVISLISFVSSCFVANAGIPRVRQQQRRIENTKPIQSTQEKPKLTCSEIFKGYEKPENFLCLDLAPGQQKQNILLRYTIPFSEIKKFLPQKTRLIGVENISFTPNQKIFFSSNVNTFFLPVETKVFINQEDNKADFSVKFAVIIDSNKAQSVFNQNTDLSATIKVSYCELTSQYMSPLGIQIKIGESCGETKFFELPVQPYSVGTGVNRDPAPEPVVVPTTP